MRHDDNTPLRQRLFNVVFLVGTFMTLSSGILNYILGLGTLDVP